MMESLIQFFGRTHPMVLHVPIGLLVGLVAIEISAIVSGRPLDQRVRVVMAWLVAASAALSAGAGLVLSLEDNYGRAALQLHQWLGIGVGVGCILAAILQQMGRIAAFRVVLLLAAAAMVPAGHFGAGITHGPGFLTEPFEPKKIVVAPVTPALAPPSTDSQYASAIAPIFANRCIGCHGEDRQKGGLALHTPEGIRAGGKSGVVLIGGNPETSEIVQRLKLPVEDEYHMPPDSKPQPTAEEVRAIEEWIKAGASFGSSPGAPQAAVDPPVRATPSEPSPADAQAIEAMRQVFVHVESVQQGSNLLLIDFSAVASGLSEPDLIRYLDPVRDQVADLSLAKTKSGDALMRLVAKMPNLVRLNASASAISDAGLALLADHPRLQVLVLTMNHLTDSAAKSLATMPALKQVYIWKSGITPDALADLRTRKVAIDSGEPQDPKPLEAEKEVTLSGSASPTAPPPLAVAEVLKPLNTTCPVMGKPIDPNFTIVYKGHVIGFCCQHCIAAFYEDPEKYESKLR